ncbi:hypothetical protein M0805_003950 [Coniferiporia weirii]|nr:hypothetical protein M0805_003950 [Coniferiporia weirii]
MARLFVYAFALCALLPIYATPVPIVKSASTARTVPVASLAKRQSISTLSTTQISAFEPFSFFASAAYCEPSTTINWSCGTNCDANAGFIPTASGGDGTDTQFWYVGFDPALNSVIAAHQGTDPSSLLADLTDIDFPSENLDSTLFPGIDSSITVHSGFADEHAKVANLVLSAVQQTLSAHPGASVTMVGHSLGAALALLDTVFLPLHLPSSTVFKTVGYGLPRVGNQAFADYVDSHVTDLTHVTNQKDPVPTVPGEFLGFVHPSGEVHIQPSEAWDACPGQDNDSDLCSTGVVSNVFEGDVSNHDGPYDVVTMGC